MPSHYLSAQETLIGPQIEPIKHISLFSPQQWEEFIEEWLDIKKKDYVRIERNGGAGDRGRDVVAYIDDSKPDYKWDCYQCKHYDKPLVPSNIWVEFGKIIYYTFKKDYPIPNKYYLIAPKNIGTKLVDLLNNPDKLKIELKSNWDKYCKFGITDIEEVALEDEFLRYFECFDFSIFDRRQPKEILDEYKNSINYIKRFGGGLPPRERVENIPPNIQAYENRYIEQLIGAYNSDKTENNFSNVYDFSSNNEYMGHFSRARESFHIAEQLRNFSRDNLGQKIFDDFQNEIYHSVVDIAEDESINNGFTKVKNVEQQATRSAIDSNPLKDRCIIQDKKGVCHQLANDGKLTWVKI